LSAVELTICDNSQSYSPSDCDRQEIIHTLSMTKPSFGECQRVNIIFNIDRDT
jgi:hypothetical protein